MIRARASRRRPRAVATAPERPRGLGRLSPSFGRHPTGLGGERASPEHLTIHADRKGETLTRWANRTLVAEADSLSGVVSRSVPVPDVIGRRAETPGGARPGAPHCGAL
ncbi:hypothetical protein tb265_14160 [Gemmatimonadetes bacterium T265]|nr:hypothetical protein tb265_14160 [Gemmatimonadetes bacterium T265]